MTVICNGGVNQSVNANLMQPGELRYGNNIVFALDTTWTKAPGITQYYSSGIDGFTDNSRYGIDFFRTNATGNRVSQFIHYSGSSLYADNKDGIFTDITGTVSLFKNDFMTADVMGSYLCMGFENVSPKKYNMTTFDDLETGGAGTAPNGKLVRLSSTLNVPGGFLWISGVDAYPNTLYYSAPNDPTDWTLGSGAGSIYIGGSDNDPLGITAIFPGYYGGLVVAKRKSLYLVQYNTSIADFTVQTLVPGIGCIAHNAVVPVQNDIIFPSEYGIHSLRSTDKYGNLDSTFLSFPIHNEYRKRIDFDRWKDMTAVFNEDLNSYLLSYPRRGDGGFNKNIMGFNIQTGKWFFWDNMDVGYLAKFSDRSLKTQTMVAQKSNNLGYVDESTYLRFGEKIVMYCRTGLVYPAGLGNDAAFKRLTVIYKPEGESDIEIYYNLDGGNDKLLTYSQTGLEGDDLGEEFIPGVSKLGNIGEFKIKSFDLEGYGSGIEFTFIHTPTDDAPNKGCDIHMYIVEFQSAGDKETVVIQ